MGSIDSKIEQILDYYLLQKRIENLKKENNEKENTKFINACFFSSTLIREWKIKNEL